MRRLGAVSLALLGLLVIASGAQAAKGVYDTFGTAGAQGGQFGGTAQMGISGVAVNSSGAGAADPGDVYVLDRGNNRIEQFDADGGFIRAFGQDVISNTGTPANSNSTGYEICDTSTLPANTAGECKAGITGGAGGALNIASSLALSGIAVDQGSGDVYVTDRGNRRVQRFDATGHFLRTFGKNVVASGPEQADEQQRLTVDATAGQYRLSFGAQTTGDIAFDASAATVQGALAGLSSIGAGNVTVTGGPGSAGGGAPYLISFGGALADTDLAAVTVSAGTTPLSGGGASAAIAVFNDGAVGYEVCTAAATCQGSPSNAGTGGAFNAFNLNSLAIAPSGAPNAGNIMVADGNNNRVQEFTPVGVFVRAFGWDVVESGPGNGAGAFEVCNAAAFEVCKVGVAGSGVGQFAAGSPSTIAEDSSGNVYATESISGFRIQKFTLPGNVVTPQGSFCGSGPAPSELCGTGLWNGPSDTPTAIAVDTSTPSGTPGTIYLLKYFPTGSGNPPLAEREGEMLQVDPTSGAVTATYMRRAEVGNSASLNSLALNTATGRLYVPRPPAPIFVIDEVPPVSVTPEATEVGATSATLHATITPAPLPSLPTFYRFEYTRAGANEWKRAPAEPNPDVNVGNGASPVAVSQKIEGLRVGTEYEVRVFAYSEFKGSEVLLDADPFQTVSQPPVIETGAALWSSPAPTNPSLTFRGAINPGNQPTTFFFEYVSEEEFLNSGFDSARVSPRLPGQAGQGLAEIGVLAVAAGLDPTKAYRYRLVATSSAGTTRGDVRTVAPPDRNARFYELVSNGDSTGVGVYRLSAVSDDGQRTMLEAQAIGDPLSLPAQRTPFLAQRGTTGWQVRQTNPFPESGRGEVSFAGTAWMPSDLSTALWSHYSFTEHLRGEVHWTFTDPDGSMRAALPKLVPQSGLARPTSSALMRGGAADLSSFVFQREEKGTQVTYLPGQPATTGGNGDIYRVSGAGGLSPTLSLVNRDEAGDLISNACGVWVGARMVAFGIPNPTATNKGLSVRPVSTDGRVAYFSARPGAGASACDAPVQAANRIRIFKRIEDASTVEISKSQCTRTAPTPCSSANGDDFFQGASANGNRAFFTTTRQLTDSDEDATLDLYLYDSSPPAGQPNLVQASAGEVVATDHPKVGSGAEVQDVVLDVSMDGSRAYFVAKGRLTPAASKGANNLYVFERDDAHPTGRIGFVTKLDSGDSNLWGTSGAKQASALPFYGPDGQGPGDGRYLLFVSKAKLAGADTDTANDLYRYSDATQQATCLTCQGNGNFDVSVRPNADVDLPARVQSIRFASEDLSNVVFATAEALVPGDLNTITDAYIWDEGEIVLISTGEPGSRGIDAAGSLPRLSADGSAAFFLTADRILPSDTNSAADVYSARVGGGFPEDEVAVSCISPEECRTAPASVAPASAPTSASFNGPGNPQTSRGAGRCPKHKVKRKGRCVKKKARKARKGRKSSRRKASENRRAGR